MKSIGLAKIILLQVDFYILNVNGPFDYQRIASLGGKYSA